MLQQGEPSVDVAQLRCMFRGTAGRSCAVGCLIPHRLYSTHMEGLGIPQLASMYPGLKDYGISSDNLVLLDRLMTIHDSVDKRNWAQAFDDFERNSPLLLED